MHGLEVLCMYVWVCSVETLPYTSRSVTKCMIQSPSSCRGGPTSTHSTRSGNTPIYHTYIQPCICVSIITCVLYMYVRMYMYV